MGIFGRTWGGSTSDAHDGAHRAEDSEDGLSTAERKVKGKLRGHIAEGPKGKAAKPGEHRKDGK